MATEAAQVMSEDDERRAIVVRYVKGREKVCLLFSVIALKGHFV